MDELTPIVGSRVVRGRDWQYGEQDGGGLGTVLALLPWGDAPTGGVEVAWDSGGRFRYRYGGGDAYDVYCVDDPAERAAKAAASDPALAAALDALRDPEAAARVASALVSGAIAEGIVPAVPDAAGDDGAAADEEEEKKEDAVHVGMRVMRGPDWASGSQDKGTGVGTVTGLRRIREDGTIIAVAEGGAELPNAVEVSWENGSAFIYRFGHENSFDVRILGAHEPRPILKEGVRVKRGADWKHGGQDGGGFGTVLAIVNWADGESDAVRVKWDTGSSHVYRWGAEGAYDVMISLDAPPAGWSAPLQQGAVEGGKVVELIPQEDSDDEDDFEQFRGLRVGARVMRGPDWKWGDQGGDKDALGTIKRLTDWRGARRHGVFVLWDDGLYGKYRWNVDGEFDLELLKEEIYIGARVERGEDWRWGDAGGRDATGTVTALVPWDRSTDIIDAAMVSWDNGDSGVYRWSDEVHDISLLDDERMNPKPLTVRMGDLVIRGPDWIFGDVDGGEGSEGTVISISTWAGEATTSGLRVGVQWEEGEPVDYRWGVDGAYDVIPASPILPIQDRSMAAAAAVAAEAFDAASWLESLHKDLVCYAPVFIDRGFDTTLAVSSMTVEDLTELGIRPGHQRIIFPAIKQLKYHLDPDSKAADAPSVASVCVICLDAPATMAIIPCGHRALCSACAVPHMLRHKCPICGRKLMRMLRIWDV